MRLTKTVVDKLKSPLPEPPETTAQAIYRDDTLKGFAVRVTDKGAKSFVVETRVDGKVRRKTIGRYPNITVDEARRLAKERLGQIAAGRDPDAEEREREAKAVTLEEAFTAYIKARKSLKERTVKDYERIIALAFPDWQRKALTAINKDMVERKHRRLGEEHGEAYANLAMRVLRAVFNFAAEKYEDSKGRSILPENPVKRLSAARAWYRVERRKTVIKAHQLPAWFQAVQGLGQEGRRGCTVRDFLLLVLFTGLRREEAARLRWQDVDMTDRTITIPDPKNRETHVLPLSDFLFDLLVRRKADDGQSEYVFPGDGAHGHLVEPKRQIKKVIEVSEVSFTIHDLRRTFITVAESLDISAYALKRLLNHKMRNDVTAGYIVADAERLRKPMQEITDHLLCSSDYRSLVPEPPADSGNTGNRVTSSHNQ